MNRVAALADGSASVVMDYRYLPSIAIAVWSGRVSANLVNQYFEELARLHSWLGVTQKYVLICLATGDCELTAAARSTAALRGDQLNETRSAHQLNSYIVMDTPMIRGTVMAIGWLSKTGIGSTLVPTLQRAFEEADTCLREAGLPWPVALNPSTYIAPALPKARTA